MIALSSPTETLATHVGRKSAILINKGCNNVLSFQTRWSRQEFLSQNPRAITVRSGTSTARKGQRKKKRRRKRRAPVRVTVIVPVYLLTCLTEVVKFTEIMLGRPCIPMNMSAFKHLAVGSDRVHCRAAATYGK